MVHADEKRWLGMSAEVRFKLLLSVTPRGFLQVSALQAASPDSLR